MKLDQESSQAIFNLMQGMSVYLPMPVYWIDLADIVQGANDLARMLPEFSSEKIVGQSLFDIYPDQVARLIVRHNREVTSTGHILSQEFTLLNKDGNREGFSAMKIPLQDRNGKIVGIIISPNKALHSDLKVLDVYAEYAPDRAGLTELNEMDWCVADWGIDQFRNCQNNQLINTAQVGKIAGPFCTKSMVRN